MASGPTQANIHDLTRWFQAAPDNPQERLSNPVIGLRNGFSTGNAVPSTELAVKSPAEH